MYIIYPDQDLMDEMNCNSFTVNRLKNEVIKQNLLLEENMPSGHSDRLYPRRVSEIYK